MAKKIINISDETRQRHTILFNNSEIILSLIFLPFVEVWFMDVAYKQFELHGVKLAVGSLHMLSSGQPFDFIVLDNSGNGLDPFKKDDFSQERCSLFLLEPDEMQEIRQVEVEI